MKKTLLALLALSAALISAAPAPCSCTIQPDKTTAIRPAPGRVVYCGLDLGSNNAKLSVVSMTPGRPTSVKDERQCKRTLGFGAKVFDSRTNAAGPLPDESIADLADTVREYQRICALDGGSIVAAGATQWARDATNITTVVERVKQLTGLTIEVLTPRQEADNSYIAASLGQSGRIVLDPGSNSFELAWQERGAADITSVLVRYGYVRGAVNDFEPAPDYSSGRTSYQTKVRQQIEDELAKLTPRLTLASLREKVGSASIGQEMLTLGQDGVVHLAVRGLLRAENNWISDSTAYDAVLARQKPTADDTFGPMIGSPLTRDELLGFFKTIQSADFSALTRQPVSTLYGQRAIVVTALIDVLFNELGTTRLVMVPQEGATGNIIRHIRK